ncbi:hypothetical protein J6590_005315 [Homalodisca vitripennis]|nr:hypothetical protein J6590_005315 [Homalodisca vitripennis]
MYESRNSVHLCSTEEKNRDKTILKRGIEELIRAYGVARRLDRENGHTAEIQIGRRVNKLR